MAKRVRKEATGHPAWRADAVAAKLVIWRGEYVLAAQAEPLAHARLHLAAQTVGVLERLHAALTRRAEWVTGDYSPAKLAEELALLDRSHTFTNKKLEAAQGDLLDINMLRADQAAWLQAQAEAFPETDVAEFDTRPPSAGELRRLKRLAGVARSRAAKVGYALDLDLDEIGTPILGELGVSTDDWQEAAKAAAQTAVEAQTRLETVFDTGRRYRRRALGYLEKHAWRGETIHGLAWLDDTHRAALEAMRDQIGASVKRLFTLLEDIRLLIEAYQYVTDYEAITGRSPMEADSELPPLPVE